MKASTRTAKAVMKRAINRRRSAADKPPRRMNPATTPENPARPTAISAIVSSSSWPSNFAFAAQLTYRLQAFDREGSSARTMLATLLRSPGADFSRGLCLGSTSGGISTLRLNAVAEQNPSPHKWDEVCTVDSPPALLGHRRAVTWSSQLTWRAGKPATAIASRGFEWAPRAPPTLSSDHHPKTPDHAPRRSRLNDSKEREPGRGRGIPAFLELSNFDSLPGRAGGDSRLG